MHCLLRSHLYVFDLNKEVDYSLCIRLNLYSQVVFETIEMMAELVDTTDTVQDIEVEGKNTDHR